jgi:hypothetical protein
MEIKPLKFKSLKATWNWKDIPVICPLEDGIPALSEMIRNIFQQFGRYKANKMAEFFVYNAPNYSLYQCGIPTKSIAHSIIINLHRYANEIGFSDVAKYIYSDLIEIENRICYIVKRFHCECIVRSDYYKSECDWFDGRNTIRYANKSRDIDKPDFKFIHELPIHFMIDSHDVSMSDKFKDRLKIIEEELIKIDFVQNVEYGYNKFEVNCDGIEECEDEGYCKETLSIPPYRIIFNVSGLIRIESNVDMVDWWDMDMISPHPNIRENDGGICYGNSDWIRCQWLDVYDIIQYVLQIRTYMMNWNSDDSYFNPLEIDVCENCPYDNCIQELCRCCDCDYKYTSECYNCSEKYEISSDKFLDVFEKCDVLEVLIFDFIETGCISNGTKNEYELIKAEVNKYFDDMGESIDYDSGSPLYEFAQQELFPYYESMELSEIFGFMCVIEDRLSMIKGEMKDEIDN